ncbi:MAG TPA: DUF1800 family protein [Bryobacteraceae bacterium]|nr:DUF1800 family protein [Bryobacteraceae bacterium]
MRRPAVAVVSLALIAFVSVLYATKKPALALQAQMAPDQKILQALNRLTFGPRPGDIATISQSGLDQWIEQQLHPADIPENPALEAKLAPLDTLRMTTAEMTRKYPAPQIVKAMIDGRLPFPPDPESHYMLRKLVARFERKQAADQSGKATGVPDLNSDGIQGGWQLEDSQKLVLDQGKPPEQAALLESMPEREQYDLLDSLPNAKRQRLYAAASPDLRRKILIFNGPVQVVNHDLTEAKLLRAAYSNRQLEQVLTDFWYNHFNVFLDKGSDRYMVTSYERDVIRPHVLGHFEDLLLATAESPAMLFYLDNWQSIGPDQRSGARGPYQRPGARPNPRRQGLNENYGRELMELHTLGVDGGYTQKDVTEVARCFTGWTIREPLRGGGFEFNERLHDKGQKHVLGVTIPAGGGMGDGLRIIDILAHSPATAHFISKALATRFVSDNPPDALVNWMAKRFLETNGDLREVMRAMIYSPEFWNPANFRSKVKSPLEMVASAVRAVNGDIDFANTLTGLMNQLGEPLYRKLEPTGYSNRSTDWMSSASLLARMNFAISLAQSKIPGVKVDTAQFTGEPSQIEHRLLLTDASPDAQSAIEAGLATEHTGPQIAGLTLGSPDFQRR